MFVSFVAWDEISLPENVPVVGVRSTYVIIGHEVAESLNLYTGASLFVSYASTGRRSLSQCYIAPQTSDFSKYCNELQRKACSVEDALSESDACTDATTLYPTLKRSSSLCMKCSFATIPKNHRRIFVGLHGATYNEYVATHQAGTEGASDEWGLVERILDPPCVAQSVNLMLLDSLNRNEVISQTSTEDESLVNRAKKRKLLWDTFDKLTNPCLSMLLHDSLTGCSVFPQQRLTICLMNTVIELKVERAELVPHSTNIVRECEMCRGEVLIPFRIMPVTKVQVLCPNTRVEKGCSSILSSRPMGLSRVGGCSSLLEELHHLLIIPVLCPRLFSDLGTTIPKGILLYGPPGTGKTYIAKAVMEELEMKWDSLLEQYHYLNPTAVAPPVVELFSPRDFLNDIETAVCALFERIRSRDALGNRSTLLFIDEVDTLCPHRETAGHSERRVLATFLTELDGLESNTNLVVLASTNRPNALDSAFRRAGRIDRELEVDVPTAEDRIEILSSILKQEIGSRIDLSEKDIREVALDCHAFVAADLKALVAMAGIESIRESVEQHTVSTLQRSHFQKALRHVKPSAMKELAIEVPHVAWSDIGGYETAKLQLQECVEWPLKYRETFMTLGVTPPRGVLLYGPPGCSKTLLAKAVATESSMNFISVKGPELFSKWVGESERAVRDVFRKARQNAPCIIFFDEVDAIGIDRHTSGGGSGVEARVLSQMLNEMDGIQPIKQVIVIGATNRPDLLDAALLRPGRLDRLVYIPLPDEPSRRAICKVHLPPVCYEKEAWSARLSEMTEGYSGAELAMVCREAAMLALREYLKENVKPDLDASKKKTDMSRKIVVSWAHLEKSLLLIRPRIPPSLIRFYDTYNESLAL